ncbi:MAG: HAMP domain-containing histidine kinase [Proteobacteria bacterium]|nr:HAMP domain-containing histidine kinase [Pseudomonadota bacterium]
MPPTHPLTSTASHAAVDETGARSAVWGMLGSPGELAVRGGHDDERTKVLWLTRLRWVAISGQLAVPTPAVAEGWLESSQVPVFLGIVIGLAAFNLWSMWRLRQPRPRTGGPLLHLMVDLLALTSLLMLSGGAWNPFAPLLFINAAMGALLLTGRHSLFLAAMLIATAACINLFALMPPAMPTRPTPVAIMLPTQVLIALVVWAMTGWLASGLAAQRKLLQNLSDHQGRVDRLRAAGALAAGFSHRLATPLNTLKMRLDRIERRDLGEAVDADVDAARDAAGICEELLRSMVGRQLDPNEMRLEIVDLSDLCRRVLKSWSSSPLGRAVDFRPAAGHRHRCKLPPVPFTQALLDLLDNAAEASAGAIALAVGCGDGVCRVEVRDHGAGWPDVVRANFGQPFLTTKGKGTGLGLYNAHSLAVALGGVLLLEDGPEGGAVAAFEIPCPEVEP